MRKQKDRRPTLEVLEDRFVPATLHFVNGILSITGTVPAGTLTITQNATTANSFAVQETGSSSFGFTGVSQILATTPTSSPNASSPNGYTVNFNLNGNTYTGSFTLKQGSGFNLVNFGEGNSTTTAGTTGGGTMNGNLTIIQGSGQNRVNIDTSNNQAASAGQSSVTIGGNVVIEEGGINNMVLLGSNSSVSVNADNRLTVKGSMTLTGADTVTFNSNSGVQGGIIGDQFLGGVTATTGSTFAPIIFQQATPAPASGPPFTAHIGTLTFGKNVTVTGGNGFSLFEFGAATFNGNVDFNAGTNTAANPYGLLPPTALTATDLILSAYTNGAGTVFTTTINGNLTFNNVGGSAVVSGQAMVLNGNMTLNLGTTNTKLVLDQQSTTQLTTINGNLLVNDQGFLDTRDAFTFGIEAIISGNVTFNLGNGGSLPATNNNTNTATVIQFNQDFGPGGSVVGSVSGIISIHAGNGVNQLLFTNPNAVPAGNPVTYNINALFGNGNDSVTLDNVNATLIGTLIGGTGTNKFTETGNGQIGSPWTSVNF